MSGILSTLLVVGGGPAPPKNLAASAYTSTGYTLSWDNDTTVTSYAVHYGPSKVQITGLTITLVSSTQSTAINTSTFTANTSFNFYVKAINASGSTFSSALAVMTNAAPPTGITPSSLAISTFTLSWTSVSGMTYSVYNGATKLTSVSTPLKTTTVAASGTPITGASGNTTYSMYVAAANTTGIEVLSTVASVLTKPNAASSIVTTPGSSNFILNFTSDSGTTLSLFNGSNSVQITQPISSGMTVLYSQGTTAILPFATYSYFLRVANTSGASDASFSVTTTRIITNTTRGTYNVTATSAVNSTQLGAGTYATDATVNYIANHTWSGSSTTTGANPAVTASLTWAPSASSCICRIIVNSGVTMCGQRGGARAYVNASYANGYTGGNAYKVTNNSNVSTTLDNAGIIVGGGGGGGPGGKAQGAPGWPYGQPGGDGGYAFSMSGTLTILNRGTVKGGAGGGGGADGGTGTSATAGGSGSPAPNNDGGSGAGGVGRGVRPTTAGAAQTAGNTGNPATPAGPYNSGGVVGSAGI